MHHGPEFTIVLVVFLALLIGAATRFFGSKLKVPYTIAMMLLGLVIGGAVEHYLPGAKEAVAAHSDHPPMWADLIQRLHGGTLISPDLIVFVFLPALIFESAFGLDVHTFRKSLGAAVVFAIPALMVATVLTALLASVLIPEAWGWSAGDNGFTMMLIFGILISATDPVAVVALMRELGVSKRLSTLVEGESLLNDGTAIVGFTVLLGLLLDPTQALTFGGVAGSFLKVVTGGLVVGFLLSLFISWWMGRTFNDPLVEITLTLILCYVAMFVAEGLLHVSGVMAIVLAGLWMSGPGRTRISPDVMHFLHRFWEMLAYIANTLVFFLVGLVVGSQFDKSGSFLTDFAIIVAAYVGIMVIRGIVTFAFRPIANLATKDKISNADALVASWGGLRGAVSMALALIVAGQESLPVIMREKLVLITAGVVLLSILVNGMTMGALLRKFGYDKPPLSDRLQQAAAQVSVLAQVETELRGRGKHRLLQSVRWADVLSGVHKRRDDLVARRDRLERELATAPATERAAGAWRQVLGIERGAYWDAFKSGTLSGAAVHVLTHEIDLQEDSIARDNLEPPATRLPPLGPFAAWVRRTIRSKDAYAKFFATIEFENLTALYDLSRGEAIAAKRVLASLDGLEGMSVEVKAAIQECYQRFLKSGTERIEELRIHLPELAQAIETRFARRVALNLEREGYEHLGHKGAISHTASEKLVHHLERQMALLTRSERSLPIPSNEALLLEVPLFQPLSADARKKLAAAAISQVIPRGESLFEQDDKGDSMYVIVRGAAEVLQSTDAESTPTLVDVLGGGEIVGEMALLTGEPRTATIRAATPLTLVKIGRDTFVELMDGQAGVEHEIWEAFAERRIANTVRNDGRFGNLAATTIEQWVDSAPHVEIGKGDTYSVPGDARHVFLLTGAAAVDGRARAAPVLIPDAAGLAIEATVDARIVILPDPPSAT